ncbi:hypothetical protein DPEC_G00304570 [Dallia pectoralis]|uniref:Uncharacterized protein n=1 Tax=Dallia pectoralis TaxID=75939 RepID=A0ACC2FDM8_DALPE|nr:hypothetical protein DPEC_G00304570 [Dallia pectoralis]
MRRPETRLPRSAPQIETSEARQSGATTPHWGIRELCLRRQGHAGSLSLNRAVNIHFRTLNAKKQATDHFRRNARVFPGYSEWRLVSSKLSDVISDDPTASTLPLLFDYLNKITARPLYILCTELDLTMTP